jgi:uncharacterized protein (TIGR03086 family)
MTEITDLHRRALDSTGRVVVGISADQLGLITPDAEWDVHTLLNHVVAGNLWAAELAAGRTIDQVGDRLDGDVIGADPAAAYDRSAESAATVFEAPGALEAPCAVSYGPVPGSVYAGHRFVDVLIHGWDLAKATGQDTSLDPELVEACTQVLEPQVEAFRAAGAIGPAVASGPGDSPQTRLLAMLGRRA